MKKFRKLISLVLIALMVLSNAVLVFADTPCVHANKTFVENVWASGDCTAAGAKAKYHCTDCDTDVLEDITENAAHTFTTLANKCDVCGKITSHTCSYSGDVSASDVTWTDNDCTKGGTATKPCDLCGENMTVTVTANAEHTPGTYKIEDVVWNSGDCTKGGTVEATCVNCAQKVSTTVAAKANHEADIPEGAKGSLRLACKFCGIKEIYDCGDDSTCEHVGNFEATDVDWDGDCTKYGVISTNCTKCGETVSLLVEPQSMHTYSGNNGICTVCGFACEHKGEVIPYYEYTTANKHVRKFECAICHKLDVTPVGTVEPDTKTADCTDYQVYESIDAQNHHVICDVCKHELSASAAHNFDSSGKCTDCLYECPHTVKTYTHNTGANTHEVVCSNCAAVIDSLEECDKAYNVTDKKKHSMACTKCSEVYVSNEDHDFDKDSKCTKCGYVCPHEDNASVFNGDNTHTTTCGNCKKTETANCTFEDNKCTVCNGKRVCHHDGATSYEYVTANTHKKICDICKEVITPSIPCTFNTFANKCDDCKHVTEHSHTYNVNGLCTKCGAECPHTTETYATAGNNKHTVTCSTCKKVLRVNEDCTFYGGTICSKCNTQHTHKYKYENISTSQHRMTCTICNATATESHQIYYEYKGKDGDDYEHYKKCRLCDFSKIEECHFNKSGKRCELCDHKKGEDDNETNNGSSSSSGGGSADYIHGLINGGNTAGALEAMKAEPAKYLNELRTAGLALPKGTVLAITGNEYNELCAVESNLRDTNNQLMYANYFGTALGFNKFSPTKTYNIYPLWSPGMKESTAVVSWANTGCQFGDTVYVVWYSYEAHDMRFIPAVVDQNGVVSVAIPKVSSMAQMTIVKCEKEAPKKSTTKKTTTTTETKKTTETKSVDAETVESVDKSVDKEESVETKSVDKNGSDSSKSASEEEETTLTVKTQ